MKMNEINFKNFFLTQFLYQPENKAIFFKVRLDEINLAGFLFNGTPIAQFFINFDERLKILS
jgi:hypothetical protein